MKPNHKSNNVDESLGVKAEHILIAKDAFLGAMNINGTLSVGIEVAIKSVRQQTLGDTTEISSHEATIFLLALHLGTERAERIIVEQMSADMSEQLSAVTKIMEQTDPKAAALFLNTFKQYSVNKIIGKLFSK
jgi:hypothetical protein